MKAYSQLSKEELLALKNDLEKQFEDVKAKGLKLDMSRGKPAKAQLDGYPEQPGRSGKLRWCGLQKLRCYGWNQ